MARPSSNVELTGQMKIKSLQYTAEEIHFFIHNLSNYFIVYGQLNHFLVSLINRNQFRTQESLIRNERNRVRNSKWLPCPTWDMFFILLKRFYKFG